LIAEAEASPATADSTMRGYFITGTDTGAGKTHITCILAHLLRQRGRRVAVSKPVGTGAEWTPAGWLCDDTRRLALASGSNDTTAITPYVFSEPLAPSVAARRAGVCLSLDLLAKAVEKQSLSAEITLVEGVGGLLCPLTDRHTVADLIAQLGLPVLVVARGTLGTLNHTLLTLEVASARHLNVVGVIVNHTVPADDLAATTNAMELRRLLKVPLLAELPYDPHGNSCAALTSVPWEQCLPELSAA
jgi:dethiobiotin synthetase